MELEGCVEYRDNGIRCSTFSARIGFKTIFYFTLDLPTKFCCTYCLHLFRTNISSQQDKKSNDILLSTIPNDALNLIN